MQFNQNHRIRHKNFGLLCGLFFITSILILTSCDQTFEPLKENNIYNFTISGYLNASADTQWVRVGTVRESIDEPPNPEGIQVTLEDIQSGETVIMNDSVFTFKNVLNYWTTMDIKNEQTYRITVERDGKMSSVTVTTPKELSSPYVLNPTNPNGADIYIDDEIEHIADVQSVYYVILSPGTEDIRRVYRFPIRYTLQHTFAYSGSNFAFANWNREEAHIEQSLGNTDYSIVKRQVFIAAGGPEWVDDMSSIDNLEYFLDGTASNVENGLGYVVGVDAKWFPQTPCEAPDKSKIIPCPEEEPFW
ncbi:hypothetical protein [Rhodohalobacter sulfatireducens]|uniref:DUF4249 domain-containing protein n=1 Tax=Rhodohalobacter sulfatireducens TaxID=2911366 RepID=A0ABS9K9Y2_9BACT|nr:hypothetical protein [Rhodohalobacter sulfatireducens]MCG2587665.1 hypothetical protein [Rhodohalobacter sulfatireducens]